MASFLDNFREALGLGRANHVQHLSDARINDAREATTRATPKPNFEAFPSTSRFRAEEEKQSLKRGENNTPPRAGSKGDSRYIYGARWLGKSKNDWNSPEYFSNGAASTKFGARKARVRSLAPNDSDSNPDRYFDMEIHYGDDGGIVQVNVTGADDKFSKMGIKNKSYTGAKEVSDFFKRMKLDANDYQVNDPEYGNGFIIGASTDKYAPANIFGTNGLLFGNTKSKSNHYWGYDTGQYGDYLDRYNGKFIENLRKTQETKGN